MEELIPQLRDLLDKPVITLDDPVKASQVGLLIVTLAISFGIAGFLRWWFRRLFKHLNMVENVESRLLALLFLIIMVAGTIFGGLRFAGIGSVILSKFFHYPLTDYFNPPMLRQKVQVNVI